MYKGKAKMSTSGKEEVFILVEAEKLSLRDKFMKHKPRTAREKDTRALIVKAIYAGVKNFYRPKYDPSLAEDGSIQFVSGKKPAVFQSYNWWVETANNYAPSHNSRLGTKLEYGAFLGVLIKKLVEEGNSIAWAWDAVCNDSKKLGHYWNSKCFKHELETTGSRCIWGFYDLANTYKILAEDEEGGDFWFASGAFVNLGDEFPLAIFRPYNNRNCWYSYSVGWIVLESIAV